MSGDKLRVEFTALSELSRSFANEADAIETLLRYIARYAEDLIRQGWSGRAAETFELEFQEVTFPATERLSQLLSDTGNVILQVSRIYLEADQEVAALFKNGSRGDGSAATVQSSGPVGGQPADATSFMRAMNSMRMAMVGHGVAVNISDYRSGAGGWSLINVDGTQGFTPNELVSQKGGTCALYAPQNLLIASGYDIDQAQADKTAHETLQENAPWWWNKVQMPDALWSKGFTMNVAEDVIAKHVSNLDYQTGHFKETSFRRSEFGAFPVYGPNRAKAEGFLVNMVQNGKPVMVSMEVNDSFGLGSGGHAATVVGVQTGSDGKLQSVLAATNWAGNQIYEIPAKQFMDDWMELEGGRYFTVDRAE